MKRTWYRSGYRNIGNLGKRICNTVENYITAILQCLQNAFSDEKFRLVLVLSTNRYLQLTSSTEAGVFGSVRYWSFKMSQADHIPVLKIQDVF